MAFFQGAPPARTTAAPTTTSAVGTPDDRSQEFRPVGAGAETTSGGALLVAAYACVWVIVFAMLIVWRARQRAIEARLASLEAALARADEQRAGAAAGDERAP